ncbi:uncharacterized protein [Callorhinus ursinus]|uniref:uncharacterized protein n=1 Tax=Callorhinus ursinus TaxID=34884 RepID=UPI003CD02A78
MIINYSLSQNSESLKLATEPPENPARAEKRGANLPKPVQKQWGLPKGNAGIRARPQDKSEPHRCTSRASAVRGASRPPETSDPRRDRRHPRGQTTVPDRRAAAAPRPESGTTPDAAATSSPRGSLTAQTPHLRLPRPFSPGIKEPASTCKPPPFRLRTAEQSKPAGPAQPGQRAPAHANTHTRSPRGAAAAPRAPAAASARARLKKRPPPHPTEGAGLSHGGAPLSEDQGPRRRRAPRGARYPSPPSSCPAIRARGEATISSSLRF